MAHEPLAPAHAEGQAAVGGRVGHRGDGQRDGVRAAGAERAVQQQVEHGVGDRAQHADAHEADHGAGGRQARDAAQVLDRGAHDVDARVGVVDPVDRDLVDAQAAALGEHEQLGVEEPAVVADVVEQAPGRRRRHGLEAALRIGEARAQHGVQQAVVGARDELALGAAHHARRARQARADGEVAVPRQQRRHEREQAAQVGRQVDVHVAEDAARRCATRPRAGRARGPCDRCAAARRPGSSCASACAMAGVASVLALSAMTIRQENGQLGAQVAVQPADAALERGLLVEDGHDDLDARRGVAGTGRTRARPRGGRASARSWPQRRRATWDHGGRRLRGAWESVAQAGGGQRDDEAGAAARGVARAHVAAVGVDDRRHDRQAEAGAPAAALAPAPPSARSARTAPRRRWSAGPGRGRGPRGARRRPARCEASPRSASPRACGRTRCAAGCRAPGAAGRGRRRPGAGRRPAMPISRPGAAARPSSTASRTSAARSSSRVRRVGHLVEAGQGQQVLDQHAHPRGLVLDAPHRLLDVGRARARRPCGRARRSRGSRPAACAARARRRR